MLKNRKNLGRRSTWGLTACFVQTQQMKALTGEPLRFSRSVKEQENSGDAQHLGRRSFLGGLRNWGPAHLTCQLSICWEGTDLGTHAHWGATVPPIKIVLNISKFYFINRMICDCNILFLHIKNFKTRFSLKRGSSGFNHFKISFYFQNSGP